MFQVHKSNERGHFDHGWLDTYHSFSFGDYYDPRKMQFRSLRVLNEDRVAAGHGFPTHPHRDMEIVTYMLAGQLEHRDSTGNGSVIRPGEVQRMTAGSGITHSERNPSPSEAAHLLQIWILPERKGLEPGYEQKDFSAALDSGGWQLLASRDGRHGAVTIHQDVELYAARLQDGARLNKQLAAGRHVWLQVARGTITLQGQAATPVALVAGDAVATSQPGSWEIVAGAGGAEVLWFDLA